MTDVKTFPSNSLEAWSYKACNGYHQGTLRRVAARCPELVRVVRGLHAEAVDPDEFPDLLEERTSDWERLTAGEDVDASILEDGGFALVYASTL